MTGRSGHVSFKNMNDDLCNSRLLVVTKRVEACEGWGIKCIESCCSVIWSHNSLTVVTRPSVSKLLLCIGRNYKETINKVGKKVAIKASEREKNIRGPKSYINIVLQYHIISISYHIVMKMWGRGQCDANKSDIMNNQGEENGSIAYNGVSSPIKCGRGIATNTENMYEWRWRQKDEDDRTWYMTMMTMKIHNAQ